MRQLKIVRSITNRENASFDKYLQEVSKEEMINAEQEIALARRIKQGDQAALEKLTKANLRFVISVAKQYQNQGLSLPDLISEGNVGMMKAGMRFDETRGFKFISYAVWWIRQSILQALAEHARVVRLPLNQIGLLNKIYKMISKLGQELEREPSIQEIADAMNMSEDKVADALRVSGHQVSLDAPFIQGEDNGLLDVIENHDSPRADEALMNESLNKEIERVLSKLDERERDILVMFFGIGRSHGCSLDEVSDAFNLTKERVRQIKLRALGKLRYTSRSKLLKQFL